MAVGGGACADDGGGASAEAHVVVPMAENTNGTTADNAAALAYQADLAELSYSIVDGGCTNVASSVFDGVGYNLAPTSGGVTDCFGAGLVGSLALDPLVTVSGTRSHRPGASSAALNAAYCAAGTDDQRGALRSSPACDLGAVER